MEIELTVFRAIYSIKGKDRVHFFAAKNLECAQGYYTDYGDVIKVLPKKLDSYGAIKIQYEKTNENLFEKISKGKQVLPLAGLELILSANSFL